MHYAPWVTHSLFTGLSLGAFALACASRPPPVPPPRPPEPSAITLPELRVTHAPWRSPEPVENPALTQRGRRGINLSADLALPTLTAANAPVRACYRGFLAFSPDAAGSITTRMRVNTDGSVSDVEVIGHVDQSLSLAMVPCAMSAVRALRFAPMRNPALVSFNFVFRPSDTAPMPDARDVPVPNRGEIRVTNPETITVLPWRPRAVPSATRDQAMTREMVDTVVPDARSLIETCFAAALVVTPSIHGDFSLQLAVEPSGNVNRLDTNARTPLNEPLRQCIITLGRQLQFPPSRAGAQVTVPVTLVLDESPTPATATTPTAVTH